MRVSSPIGELPFEPQRLALKDGGVEISGVMGAWPAHVRIDATDLPALARTVAKPAAALFALTAVIFGLARRARPRHDND